jgi:hypothetical protein
LSDANILPGRQEQRFASNLSIALAQATGVSRNVSASGIYFETEAGALGDSKILRFAIDFRNPQGMPVRMRCAARVVRIEPLGSERIGVAARFEEMIVERAEEGGT